MKLFEFLSMCERQNELIEFLRKCGVINTEMICPRCNNKLALNMSTLLFRCRKVTTIKPKKKKRKISQCEFKQSVTSGTWLANSNLNITTIARFIAYFLMIRPPRYAFYQEELELSDKSIVDWSSFCREVCISWLENQQNPIGGEGIVVEIDEAKIGKRKYNRGRLITGKWIFGAFERGTGKAFIVPVEDRTKETLLSTIKKWILPGTTIMSDMWRAYNCLNDEGFTHLIVNHSMNFVDPETGAHTQNIERTWREVRANIPRYGTREKHLIGYIAEFFFKRRYKFNDRIVAFFEAIGNFFPPGWNEQIEQI